MSVDLTQFLETFYEECFEGLDVMETELLELDVGNADNESINTIFRAAHSIKGGSGTFGFSDVSDYTHLLETILGEMREEKRDITETNKDLLLQSVDILRDMLQSLRDDLPVKTDKVAASKKLLEQELSNSQDTESENITTDSQLVKEIQDSPTKEQTWSIQFTPHLNLMQTGNDPIKILRELNTLGELSIHIDDSKIPDFENLNPEEIYLSWQLKLSGDIEETNINDVFAWVEDECDLTISASEISETKEKTTETTTMIEHGTDISQDTASTTTNKTSKKPAKQKQTDSTSIRVAINKIDDLINMMGELVITQSMLTQMGEVDEFDNKQIEMLRAGLAQLERNTRELQENVMSIRMLPISFAFQRFPRLVHDLSGQLSKKINLKLSGEGTELDKTVMEKITDPLVHLIRNSIDHGIETPEERRKAGKDDTGTIELNAYHHGGNIVIEIIDDGKGLDRDKILAKAMEKGLVTQNDNSLNDEEVFDLIFKAGFSTADVVSDVSGRGVGMDVVKKNIRSMGGTVDVKSEQGTGTTFTIRLPLTLAILDGQSIYVGDETYIIPLISIVESIQVDTNLINTVAGGNYIYRLRDEYIPIIKLYEIFNIKTETRNIDDGLLVIVESDGKKIALFVDDLLGQQQVVIKSLETNYKKVEGVSGATILGNGSVALILDVAGLINLSKTIFTPPPSSLANESDVAA